LSRNYMPFSRMAPPRRDSSSISDHTARLKNHAGRKPCRTGIETINAQVLRICFYKRFLLQSRARNGCRSHTSALDTASLKAEAAAAAR
jgi:hypothetical protein